MNISRTHVKRRLLNAGAALAAAAVMAGTLTSVASASAVKPSYNPCRGDDPPPTCWHWPPSPPTLPPDYDTYTPIGSSHQEDWYGAEHVTTSLVLEQRYDRATNALVAADVKSNYHVWNDYLFQGFHVTVYEAVFDAAGSQVMPTPQHVIGVTPKFWDPYHADIRLSFTTAVSQAVANKLAAGSTFTVYDRFSN